MPAEGRPLGARRMRKGERAHRHELLRERVFKAAQDVAERRDALDKDEILRLLREAMDRSTLPLPGAPRKAAGLRADLERAKGRQAIECAKATVTKRQAG